MKKCILPFLSMVLICGYCFLSCTSENDTLLYSKSEKIADVNLFKNLNISEFRNPKSLTGTFSSFLTKSNEFIIYTETNESKEIFILQDFNSKKSIENIKNVVFLDDFLIVFNQQGEIYYIYVNREDIALKNSNIKSNFKGKSLNEEKVNGLIYLSYPISDDFIDIQNIKNTESVVQYISNNYNRSCQSGGSGSTSCSYGGGSTGCSVSCGGGYYACCSVGIGGNSCYCVKER